jgi:electron transfer flavoprotein alpha subunit
MDDSLPALVTVERIHTLRLPRAFGRTRGSLEIWDAAKIGADLSRCGRTGSPTRVIETFENPRGLRTCTFIKSDQASALIERKRRERPEGKPGDRPAAEASEQKTITAGKLPEAWVVGAGELEEKAASIAERVRVLERDDPRIIAGRIEAGKPGLVLWPADWWGRWAAPQAAAVLGAGLCADCTALQTDGKDIWFFRPAWGGNLIGKIRCGTVPAMATMRLKGAPNGSLIISMGLGMLGLESQVAACAGRLNAELGASRSAVDAGMAPYEAQVGLTGRMVSPGVYLALGISGALAHTCAIEGSGCVIAVNTDNGARIFEYADYGIVAEGREVLSVL